VPFQRAARWLRKLTHDGVLVRLTKGNSISKRASEYRYLGEGGRS
jgi:hypothetical protein